MGEGDGDGLAGFCLVRLNFILIEKPRQRCCVCCNRSKADVPASRE